MLHLFDDVFLQQDKYINIFNYRVVISEKYATDDLKDTSVYPKTLKTGKTWNEALGDITFSDFIRDLYSIKEKKIVIYADEENFSKILVYWLKSTTNMDKDSFEIFADCYGHKMQVHSNPCDSLISRMKSMWDTAEVSDFSDLDFSPSIEFMLATAFYDRNFSKKEKLKKIFAYFIKRIYELYILEVRKHIDTYILDADAQKILGGHSKTIKNYLELPKMSVYKSPYFKNLDGTPYIKSYSPGTTSKLDLSLISDEDVENLCNVTDEFAISTMGYSDPGGLTGTSNANFSTIPFEKMMTGTRTWPVWMSEETKALVIKDIMDAGHLGDPSYNFKYMDSARKGILSEEDYNNVLDDNLKEKIAMVHIPQDLTEQILFVLLPYIKSLAQQGMRQKLVKFTLK
jgi:hypothetical protein